MPKIKYQDINIGPARLAVIVQANAIIAEYAAQGFDLTLRQLYYQFVSRDLIPNRQSEYKKLGDTINDGRLAGLIDWDAIVDRTRNLRSLSHWEDPSQILEAVGNQYRLDLWDTQTNRVEVWIEKDALVGVIEGVCNRLRVPFFSCRGYTSQSEMWAAARRLRHFRRGTTPASLGRVNRSQEPVIIHLGDHDPSGIDMSRDIEDRLRLFMDGRAPEFRRIALNFDQVEQYHPPPNPTKMTDSRSSGYVQRYGDESWELDALDPTTLAGLIETEVLSVRDEAAWAKRLEQEEIEKAQLAQIADRYADVVDYLTN